MDVDRVQIVLPRPLALRATLGAEFSAAAQTAPITLLFASDEAWLNRAVDAVESVCDPLGRAEVRLPFAGKVAVRAWLRQSGEADAHWVELEPIVVDEARPTATIELRSKRE